MFQDTQPAPLDRRGSADAWSAFRVSDHREVQALLRQLHEGSVPVNLSAPGGTSLTTTLWAVDAERQRLSFNADDGHPNLQPMVEADEVVAVAYLDSVKLQFDLHGLLLVRRGGACALQSGWPSAVYRFQRRDAYRVRPSDPQAPSATLRHPSMPEMKLTLRMLDVSIGGCALLLPGGVPPLQPGTRIGDVHVELDADTRFEVMLILQHVSVMHNSGHGVRLGCEWGPIGGAAQRSLQRWIDQTQKRRRLTALR